MISRFNIVFGRVFSVVVILLLTNLTVGAEFPNLVLILADDLGSTDISPFGSEINTPNIAKLAGNSALFKGDYKIVINKFKQNETEWRLHNIKTDPGETNDLIDDEPQFFGEMRSDLEAWAEENDVLPMPEGYNRGSVIFRGGFN